MDLEGRHVDRVLADVEALKLVNDVEHAEVLSVLDNTFPFAETLQYTDSVHAHVKVEDVDALPHDELVALGYHPENAEPGYIKYSTDAGLNFIFSSIPIAQDDSVEGAVILPKPFMDHVGIDMRDEADATQIAFDAIITRAAELNWREVTQAGPVHCCHTQVKAKHWAYPPECWAGWRRPIEFAFGTLQIFHQKMGCDLRPMDPGHPMAAADAQTTCSAASEVEPDTSASVSG
ncbi:hypothetical protein [Amycolatopsis sp. NPDC051071]|uniref:hypothetical protein n=1 Tax=Amycolatopsis sp. NPDC051071 TaxID=3154637 RepID=UPI0034192D7E